MHAAHDYTVIAEYPDKHLLQSGWLIGEQLIAKKPCIVSVRCGEGKRSCSGSGLFPCPNPWDFQVTVQLLVSMDEVERPQTGKEP